MYFTAFQVSANYPGDKIPGKKIMFGDKLPRIKYWDEYTSRYRTK